MVGGGLKKQCSNRGCVWRRAKSVKKAIKMLYMAARRESARRRRKRQTRVSPQNPDAPPDRSDSAPHTAQIPDMPNPSVNNEPSPLIPPQEQERIPFDRVEQPADASVFLQHLFHIRREVGHFNAVEHIDHFSFANLHRIQSFIGAINAVHGVVQSLLDRIRRDIQPGDFIQLRIDGGRWLDPIYSLKQARDDFNAESFLNAVANALQSNAECLAGEFLTLRVLIVRNRRGGGRHRRRLKSILYTQIIKQKKRWLFDFNNYDSNLCLAASLFALLEKGSPDDSVLLARARELHRELDIPDNQLVSFSDIEAFEKHLGITIRVLYHNRGDWRYFHTGKTSGGNVVYILHHDDHYYGITNIKAFIGANYFCDHCSSVFHHKNNHSCQYFCKACQSESCVETAESIYRCSSCRVFCRSSDCLDRHRVLAAANKAFCKTKIFCDSCYRYVVKGSEPHECKGLRCNICKANVVKFDKHECYMQPYQGGPDEDASTYIIYDFECQQDTGKHIPNFIFATPLHGSVSWEFKGDFCTRDFVNFFLSGAFEDCTFIAHNAGRYDSYFIVKQLIIEKIQIDMITQGGRLLCVTVPSMNLRFIDSLNFIPMKLSKLPQAMGFSGGKGHFPHFFNTKENQNYVGPIPDAKYYGPEYMMPDDRKEFMEWYESQKDCTFDFNAELKAYCKQDVEVLRKSCERYRDRIMDMAKKKVRRYCTEKRKNVTVTYCVDPFQHITLASVCMAIYRFKFLPKDTIAVVPSDNYHKAKKRYSTPAIQWLMYVSHSENIVIQHALRGGEKKVGNYYLDGYAYVDGRHIAFEFNGCFFHGCGVCFSANAQNNVTKTTYSQLYQASLAKMRYLQQQGYTLRVLWEHEWREMIETNSDLQAFLLKMQFPVPLEPRDALYGGRTNAIKLYHRLADGETINYYDFTSLYPFINKTKTYPIGHPTIIYEDFTYIKNYFGIAKVKVYPPRDLFFPVLPVKMNHKLMFPLCYTCALNSLSDPCSHTDEERSIVGTWCTIELEMAVEKGYRIAHTYEIWHFPETSDNLFASYIELHLRDKQEASGFPSWCTDDDKKNAYIDSFLQKEGVQLRKEEIGVNPAKRQISKLFLNSLWGKFAQKSNLPCTNIVTDPDKLFEYVFLPQYEISGLNFIDDETANVTWKYAKEHHTVNKNTNIFIACFTTAYARLELYSLLDRLQERCLYHDTDSVMFVHREGDWNPPLGDYLGELTSEIPDDTHITEFVSAGPKTYGYKLNTGKTVLKVKGITLNTSATQVVNFDSLKDLVLDYQRNSDPETQKTITVEQPGFVRDKKYWDIETRPLQKTQRCVYTKRYLLDDFTTLPYGY
ncbi:uncharacterized protein [Eleutherodactylus coqui]|uniref:uncharacterized protein isoform X3 n=2 Tax=Eleutherodactylus coqui TaxID=57060 RepID=UPI0034626441